MLSISADLRQLALIIILTRAGLSLDLADLKRVGRPALLVCFVPACFEIFGMVLLAPRLLGIATLDAGHHGRGGGCCIPGGHRSRMIRLMDEGWGAEKSIPQLILGRRFGWMMSSSSCSSPPLPAWHRAAAFPRRALSRAGLHRAGAGRRTGLGTGWPAGWTAPPAPAGAGAAPCCPLAFLLVEGETDWKGLIPSPAFWPSWGPASASSAVPSAPRPSPGAFSTLWVGSRGHPCSSWWAEVDVRYAAAAGAMAVITVLGPVALRAVGSVCACWGPASRP